MKITTLSSLTLAAAALVLCATPEANAFTGCGASKAASGLTTTLEAPGEGDPGADITPDNQALIKAVGSFGAIAALITGGTLLYRKQRFDTDPMDSAPSPADHLGVEVEPVLVSEALLESSASHETQKTEMALPLSR